MKIDPQKIDPQLVKILERESVASVLSQIAAYCQNVSDDSVAIGQDFPELNNRIDQNTRQRYSEMAAAIEQIATRLALRC